jgi:hypothetical protein
MKRMPPRTRAASAAKGPSALTDTDVSQLRERLEKGGRPRVMLLVDTALGPAGTSVPIVSFEDPAEGEFISVRLRDDVVPFSPSELSLPTRGRRATSATPSSTPSSTPPAAPPAALPLDPPLDQPMPTPVRPARLVAVPEPPDASPAAEPPNLVSSPAAAKKPGRKPSRSGTLSVTLRFTGQSWTYETARGGRRSSARPLNLAAVRAFADRLDDPALRRDLQSAIDICRQQAKTRADELRAELERVEIELADLDE